MKPFLLFFLFFSPPVLFAQELCANGMDDDGDGLIDLNDADCSCHAADSVLTSLIPNPSFEDTLCCPTGVSQMDCVASWIQASYNATTDFMHTCGYSNVYGTSPTLPLPGGGSGYVGFHNVSVAPQYAAATSYKTYQEYLGACLASPIPEGKTYEMSLYFAHVKGPQTLTFSIFGTPDCNDLPFGAFGSGPDTCPIGSGSWIVLATDTIILPQDHSWKQVHVSFRTPLDIHAIVIGGSCNSLHPPPF